MNGTYFLGLALGAAVCTGLFAWRLHRRGMNPRTALLALPVAILLGLVMSKVGYFLLELRDQYARYGMAGLLTDRPSEFSFVSGCFGVVLAVIIAARVMKLRPMQALDAFAPCGALMAAFARACEGLLDPMALVGMGNFVENDALWFFPVAVENAMLYSWFYAVFMLEALCALVCAAVGFAVSHKRQFAPGRVFLHTVVFLALPQVFSERMLSQCMRWGFVRIEQLLCALIVFAVIAYACVKQRGGWKSYIPVLLAVLCLALIIDMEFTLDNKPPFGLELPPVVCYGIMIASLCSLGGLNVWAFSRLNKKKIA